MTSTTPSNRAARRANGARGAHRSHSASVLRQAGVAATMMLATTGLVAGIANAAPQLNPLPGSNNPTAPSTINPAAPPIPSIAPSNYGPGAIPDPPSTLYRENPFSSNAPLAQAIFYQGSQAPTPLDAIFSKPAPPLILPEAGTIRVGKYQTQKPTWVTMAEMNSVNRYSAYIESRIAQFWLSQGFSEKEADRRAATMSVGGLIGGAAGGAAGFALGVIPGAAVGGGIGALAGLGIGAGVTTALGLPVNALFPVAGTALYGSFIGVGSLVGAGVGLGVGALAGGAIGGLIVGVPAALVGVGLGSVFGGGDPNQNINQPWLYRNGKGEITPKKNKLEFDYEGNKVNPQLGGVKDAHINLEVKDDDTWVVKLGDERWLGASKEQRDKYLYDDLDERAAKALPFAPGFKPGSGLRSVMEDENGVFQNTIRDFLANTAKQDPAHAQYNPKGDIKDTSRREERVHYGYTSTPDQWDEPRYLDGDDPRAQGGSENATATGNTPATTPGGQAAAGAPVQQAPAPAPAPAKPQTRQVSAPAVAPALMVKTGNVGVDKVAADIQDQVSKMIPGVPAAR